MKKATKSLIVGVVMGGGISSCQLDPYEIPAEEAYTRAFIKQFGVIDKNQDWNIAERKSVTVNPGNATQVKVYAYVGNTKYIFANYSDVKGTQTLEFDLPEGIEEVIVKVNGVEKTTKVGGTVDFSGVKTRAVTTYDNKDGILTVTKDDWLEIEPERILDYREKLPEGKRNVDKYTQNFHFVNNGDFVIYPIYYQTSHTNTLGIYVKDESGNITKYPISCPKNGGEIEYTTDNGTEYEKQEAWLCITNTYGDIKDWGINTDFKNYTKEDEEHLRNVLLEHADQVKNMVKFTGEIKEVTAVEYPGEWSDNETTCDQYGNDAMWAKDLCIRVRVSTGEGGKTYTWNDINGGGASYDESKKYTKFRSRGIKIHMAENVTFGMYIQLDNGTTYYSQEELNPDPLVAGDTDQSSKRACHAVTYQYNNDGKQYRVLAFEDWDNSIGSSASDMDLNDLVFYITSDNIEDIPEVKDEDKPDPDPTPDPDPEDKSFPWLIACEDLGSTGDIDFNDIVFKVEYVNGQDKAYFTPLASGAALKSNIYYTNAETKEKELIGEIHELLGGSAPSFINTTSSERGKAGETRELTVGTEFSMAYIGEKDANGNIKDQNMGGFVIETLGRKEHADGWEAQTLIEAPKLGDAPAMICLPYEYTVNNQTVQWAWPREYINIKEAYPNFDKWVSNTDNYYWYTVPYGDDLIVK